MFASDNKKECDFRQELRLCGAPRCTAHRAVQFAENIYVSQQFARKPNAPAFVFPLNSCRVYDTNRTKNNGTRSGAVIFGAVDRN